MKKIFLATILFALLSQVKAQDVLDSISNQTCDCVTKLDVKTLPKEKLTIELGLCMMQAAQPYEKELMQKYGVDMKKANRGEGEKLGRLVGLKMASTCTIFKELITRITSDEPVVNSIEGTIVELINEQFVTIVIKDEDGRDVKIIWLDYFKNSEKLLQKGNSKNVTIEFSERELFNPKFNDYIKFKVATGIRFDD